MVTQAAAQLHYAFAATGRFIGSVAPSDSVANAAASLLFLFNLLLCGFFVAPDDLSPAWRFLARLLPASAGYEALVIHEFADQTELYLTSKVGSTKYRSSPLTGEAVLRCFGFDVHRWFGDHIRLVLFSLAADCAACIGMVVFAHERR